MLPYEYVGHLKFSQTKLVLVYRLLSGVCGTRNKGTDHLNVLKLLTVILFSVIILSTIVGNTSHKTYFIPLAVLLLHPATCWVLAVGCGAEQKRAAPSHAHLALGSTRLWLSAAPRAVQRQGEMAEEEESNDETTADRSAE